MRRAKPVCSCRFLRLRTSPVVISSAGFVAGGGAGGAGCGARMEELPRHIYLLLVLVAEELHDEHHPGVSVGVIETLIFADALGRKKLLQLLDEFL